MKLKTLVPAMLGLLFVVGCGASNPAVGTWKLQMSEDMKKNMPPGAAEPNVTAEFKADNTFSISADFMGQKKTGSGTYTVEEKTIKMKTTMEDGKAASNPKEESVTLSEDGKSFDLPGSGGMGKMVKQ
jgi:hypothetical protein